MKTGVAYLAVAGTAIIWSAVAAQLVTPLGVKPVLVVGWRVLTVGLLYFTQVSVDGSYVGDLLPGLPADRRRDRLLLRADLDRRAGRRRAAEAGLASGLINTSQQIGGALGIAALSTIATSTTTDSVKSGTPVPEALTDGFQNAFWVGAAITLAGVIVSLVLVRQRDFEPAQAVEASLEAA